MLDSWSKVIRSDFINPTILELDFKNLISGRSFELRILPLSCTHVITCVIGLGDGPPYRARARTLLSYTSAHVSGHS